MPNQKILDENSKVKQYIIEKQGEHFLTDEAEKHKRNLLFVSTILLFLFFMDIDYVRSAFGFSFKTAIPISQLVAPLTLVLAYFMFMYFIVYLVDSRKAYQARVSELSNDKPHIELYIPASIKRSNLIEPISDALKSLVDKIQETSNELGKIEGYVESNLEDQIKIGGSNNSRSFRAALSQVNTKLNWIESKQKALIQSYEGEMNYMMKAHVQVTESLKTQSINMRKYHFAYFWLPFLYSGTVFIYSSVQLYMLYKVNAS